MRKWMIWMVCLALGLTPCAQAFAMEEGQRETMQEEGEETAGEANESPAPQVDPLGLYAQSAVLADGLTGRVLYGRGRTRSVPWPAPQRL